MYISNSVFPRAALTIALSMTCFGQTDKSGMVQEFALQYPPPAPCTPNAKPHSNMGSTPVGNVKEFPIPTHNSRPIEIVAEPGGGQAMWFTEETGNKVGRIGMDGTITEFPVPNTQDKVILAGLAFDNAGNLWVQQYIDMNNPDAQNGTFTGPVGSDYIIKIDKSILEAKPSDISKVPFTFYKVPTRQTVMHRIIQGPDGNIWFTEMMPDKVGRLVMSN